MPKKRKRNEETNNATTTTNEIPPIITKLNLQPVQNLSFEQDSVTHNKQVWLIKAPKNFDPKLLDGIKLKLKDTGHIKTLTDAITGSDYIITNKGLGESAQQVVGFVPSGEQNGAMTCTLPFAREIEITESFAQQHTKNTTFRGTKHKAYQNVPQIKTMGYRLKPAGYSASSPRSTVLDQSPVTKKKKKTKQKKNKGGQ